MGSEMSKEHDIFQQKKINESLKLSAELWNTFYDIPLKSRDDLDDFRFYIHSIQRLLKALPKEIGDIPPVKGICTIHDAPATDGDRGEK